MVAPVKAGVIRDATLLGVTCALMNRHQRDVLRTRAK